MRCDAARRFKKEKDLTVDTEPPPDEGAESESSEDSIPLGEKISRVYRRSVAGVAGPWGIRRLARRKMRAAG